MQHSPYEIKGKLLQALDQEYNVVDMAAVFEVITALEKAIITKEALEKTRIGKYINELRKKTNNEQLARRAKDLVKSWRKLLPQSGTRVNGEEVISIGSSPGGMTVLGPGPGPGFGPGPGPGNRAFKTCVSVTGVSRYKSSSPSLERSSSPYFSSASNSPLLNSQIIQGSNMPLATSNYAPVKFSASQRTTRAEKTNLVKNLLNLGNQSKSSSQIFKPISPSLATVRHTSNSVLSGTNMLPSQRSCSPNASPELQTNSRSSSPLSPPMNLYPRPISVPVIYGSSHSTLDIAKTNAANKRLRKDVTFSNNCATSKELMPNSKSSIGNGMSVVSESILPSESSAFKSVNLLNFKSVDESEKTSIVTNLKPRKRKRSFDKNELETTLDGALASLPSGSKLPKVKTTQQLIAELQAKRGVGFENLPDNEKKKYGALSPNSLSSADYPLRSSEAEVSRTKSELLKKFLISSQSARQDINQECPTGEPSLTQSDCGSPSVPESNSVININREFQASAARLDPVDEEINRILSALPPLNKSEINLEDDSPSPTKPTPVTSDDVNRLSERWEFVNGLYDCHGNWRSWQECCEKRTYYGTLRILPYVNID